MPNEGKGKDEELTGFTNSKTKSGTKRVLMKRNNSIPSREFNNMLTQDGDVALKTQSRENSTHCLLPRRTDKEP